MLASKINENSDSKGNEATASRQGERTRIPCFKAKRDGRGGIHCASQGGEAAINSSYHTFMRQSKKCKWRPVQIAGVVMFGCAFLLGGIMQASAETTAIYGTVIDSLGDAPIMDGVVVVCDERIVAVGPTSTVIVPAGSREVRIEDATILPGLIDAHVHKACDASTLAQWAASGVTTVRDLGADSDMNWDGVRDGFAADPTLATLIVSGPFVTVPDGYGLKHGFPLAVAVSSPTNA